MRKIMISLFSILMVCFLSSVVFAACSASITSIEIKSGTIANAVVKDEEFDTTNVEAVISYSDGRRESVDAGELTFGEIDTTATGIKDLEVTYNGFTTTIKIKVVASEADINTINSFSSQIVTDYAHNKSEQTNKQEEFYDLEQPYYVGDDNAFNFRINASGINEYGDLVQEISKIRTEISIMWLPEGGEATLLTGTQLANYAVINTEDSTVDFTEEAIGEKFTITVKAVNYDEEYFDEQPSFMLTVKVIDGYNVYNAADFSVLDNSHNDASSYWVGYKTAEMEEASENAKGIILHADITILKEDVPAGYFWTQAEVDNLTAGQLSQTDLPIVGSLKDEISTTIGQIYKRILEINDEFNFIGNYYQIDASQFPKSVLEAGEENGIIVDEEGENAITTHSSLIRIIRRRETSEEYPVFNFMNVSLKGNAKRSARSINSGGILLMKVSGTAFNAYNTIYNDFFLGYFVELYQTTGWGNDGNTQEQDLSSYYIYKCKGYNCYNSLIYANGAKDVIIEDCEFIGAGGPVIVADHVWYDKSNDFVTNISVINSKLESYVAGQEPWFVTYGATAIAQGIVAANQAYNGTGRSMLKTVDGIPNMLNFICVYKPGETTSLTGAALSGSVTMYATRADYNAQNPTSGASVKKSYGLILDGTLARNALGVDKCIYFESDKNGGYVNTLGAHDGYFYDANYINAYIFNGMGAMFELFSTTA